MNVQILRAAVIQVLADHGGLVPEKYVMLALAVDLGIKPTFSELREVLPKLEEEKYVVSIRRDDSVVLWSASALGKSKLAEITHG